MVKKTFVNNEAYTKTEAYLTKGASQSILSKEDIKSQLSNI